MSDESPKEPKAQVIVDEQPTPRGDRPRLLVTNDDGIESEGIRRLGIALAQEYEVVIAAPATDMSGSGTGIGRLDVQKGIDLRRVDLEGLEAYTVAGPPGLAVMAAALGAFGRSPDLVVSGINSGINTGHSVIHSGTVGAVLTARTFGSQGLAVSLAYSDPWQWETAVYGATLATRWILGQPRNTVLNLNAPAVPVAEVRGARWADLDSFGYFRVAIADLPNERLQFELRGSSGGVDPGSDTALCQQNYLTLTPLSSIEPAPFPAIPAESIVPFPRQ